MTTNCEIAEPKRTFHYWDKSDNDNELLGIDIRGCELETCDTLWVRAYCPRRGGDLIPPPPDDFTEESSLRLSLTWAWERFLLHKPDAPRTSSGDLDTVWFGLDVHDIGQCAKKDLSKIQFLLIPCDALEAAKVPGFESGCIPRMA